MTTIIIRRPAWNTRSHLAICHRDAGYVCLGGVSSFGKVALRRVSYNGRCRCSGIAGLHRVGFGTGARFGNPLTVTRSPRPHAPEWTAVR